jgi:hypothetical protein
VLVRERRGNDRAVVDRQGVAPRRHRSIEGDAGLRAIVRDQLRRTRDALNVTRGELELGLQALRRGDRDRALQHFNTTFINVDSTERKLEALTAILKELKE